MTRAAGRAPPQALHPRHWGELALLGGLWLLARLPWRLALTLGMAFGWLGYAAALDRRRIARRNLELCFPEWSAAERERQLRRHFLFLGKGLAEIALGWFGSTATRRIPCEIRGLEHLEAAQRDGRPVILLSAHFTSVELAARLLGPQLSVTVIYRPMAKKPFLDRAMRRARARNLGGALPREDIRGILRRLRSGVPVWYAGDQDYGRRHSVYAPFFGVQTATITALTRLARMSDARVVPLFFNAREDHRGYEIRFAPALEGFPSGDEVADATRMNAVIEEAVRAHPAQYLWIHRRFKHRPEGDAYPDAPNRRRQRRRRHAA